jgi:hypothetical protein
MSQDRPTPLHDAAGQLKIGEKAIRQMMATGQIAIDSMEPLEMVLVEDSYSVKPRYSAVAPAITSIHAISVKISGTAKKDAAEAALKVLQDLGFAIKVDTRETHITR